MAIWNNNTCNSHREFYNKYGTTWFNAQGVHNLSYFDQYILQNGKTIAYSLFKFIGQNVDFDGSSSSSSSSGDAEIIKEHIDKILDKYNVKTIDDLEALGEVQEIYNKGQEENTELKGAITDYSTTIDECEQNIATNNSNILDFKNEIKELENDEISNGKDNSSKINELKAEIAKAEKAIEDAEKKQKEAEISKNNAEAKIEKNSKLENPNLDLADLDEDIQNLKTYMKHLKKAEGKVAIEELVNELEAATEKVAEHEKTIEGLEAEKVDLKAKLEEAEKRFEETTATAETQAPETAPVEETQEAAPETDAELRKDLNNALTEEVKPVIVKVPNVKL